MLIPPITQMLYFSIDWAPDHDGIVDGRASLRSQERHNTEALMSSRRKHRVERPARTTRTLTSSTFLYLYIFLLYFLLLPLHISISKSFIYPFFLRSSFSPVNFFRHLLRTPHYFLIAGNLTCEAQPTLSPLSNLNRHGRLMNAHEDKYKISKGMYVKFNNGL
jgi:hypothetical protein